MGVIVALDSDIKIAKAKQIVNSLCGESFGFKIGLPFIIQHGLRETSMLARLCTDSVWIADLKLADIGTIMTSTVSILLEIFDAYIAHSFIGYRQALDELNSYLKLHNKKLILVASMSHHGSLEVYDRNLLPIIDIIQRTSPWAVVAPATRPKTLRLLREKLPYLILAPGIGAQGAKPGDALCEGADYEIIGRLITRSNDPIGSFFEIVEKQKEKLSRCRRYGRQS